MAMGGFIFGAPGLPKTPEELARMRAIVDAMAARQTPAPHNIGEGLTAIGNALAYRSMLNDLTAGEANLAKQQASLGLPQIGSSAPVTPAPAPTSAPTPIVPPSANATAGAALSGTPLADQPAPLSGGMPPQASGPDFGRAIASIESGGAKDPYSLMGPATKTGDRALGKYQVMASNVPEWTKAALGQAMTPQQFLASPEAQDAVFKHQFGQYVAKYGPEGAAKAWFAGPGGMNNPNASDSLGTTVAAYARKFMNALGPTSANAAEVNPATAQLFSPDATLAQPLQPAVANAGSPPPEMGVLPYAPDAGPMPPMPANVPLPPMRPDAAPATFDQRFGAMQTPTLAQTPAPVQVASLGGGVTDAEPASPRQQIAQLLQSPPTGAFTPGALPDVTNVPTRTLDLAPGGARDAVARALMGQGAPAAPTPITSQAAPVTTGPSAAQRQQIEWAQKVLKTPEASKTQQALAGEILKQAMTVDKPTNDIINYRMSVSQGFKGTFDDWLKQRALLTKSQTIAPPEKGMRYVYDNNGNVVSEEPIPGSAAQRQAAETAGAKQTTTDVLATAYKSAKGLIGPDTTGIVGKGLGAVLPPSQAAELRRQVHVLTSNASIEALNAMRRQSPTGGALGNVTEAEERILAATAGAINPDSSPAQFKTQLDNYYRTLLRIVNGPEAGDRMFRELQQGQAGGQPSIDDLVKKYGGK